MIRQSLLVVLAVLLAGGTCVAAPAVDSGAVHYAWANVTRVNPIYQDVQIPDTATKCYKQPVVHHDSGGGTAATLLGAVIGGVLGNTVGKGDGRKAATVAGAVAGGVIGNQVSQPDDTAAGDGVTHCVPAAQQGGRTERRIVGYDVEYRYRGESYVSRMNYDPGERLRVRVSVTPAD